MIAPFPSSIPFFYHCCTPTASTLDCPPSYLRSIPMPHLLIGTLRKSNACQDDATTVCPRCRYRSLGLKRHKSQKPRFGGRILQLHVGRVSIRNIEMCHSLERRQRPPLGSRESVAISNVRRSGPLIYNLYLYRSCKAVRRSGATFNHGYENVKSFAQAWRSVFGAQQQKGRIPSGYSGSSKSRDKSLRISEITQELYACCWHA